MIKIMSKINITNLRRPELPMESMMVSEPRDPEVNLGNTSSTGVSSLYNNDSLLLEEEWNELFKNSREFTSFDRYSSDEAGDGRSKQYWSTRCHGMFLPNIATKRVKRVNDEDLERNRITMNRTDLQVKLE